MASTFGSLTFERAREDVWVRMPSRDALVTERPVPYASGEGLTIVDIGGLGAHHYDDTIYVLAADVGSWRAALLTTATLTIAGADAGEAVLVQLSDEQALLDRTLYSFSARWLLDAEVVP